MYIEAAGSTSDSACRCSSMNGWSASAAPTYQSDEIEPLVLNLYQPPADALDIEKFVHESQQSLCFCIDDLKQFGCRRIQVTSLQQIDRVRDRGQRVSQLMAQHGDELIFSLAVREETRRHVRASGGIFERQQQQIGAIHVPGDPPGAQRHRAPTVTRKVDGHFPVFQRLGLGEKRLQSLRQFRNVPPAIVDFVQEPPFSLLARNSRFAPNAELTRRMRCAPSSTARGSLYSLDDDVRIRTGPNRTRSACSPAPH